MVARDARRCRMVARDARRCRIAIRLTACIAGMRGGTVPAATASHEVKGLKLRSNREAS
jgi:hypothetical protein